MSWEETVLSDEQIFELVASKESKELLKKFPGTAKVCDVYRAIVLAAAKVAYEAGIREVVEWIEKEVVKLGKPYPMLFPLTQWQSQKKEWGIKEK